MAALMINVSSRSFIVGTAQTPVWENCLGRAFGASTPDVVEFAIELAAAASSATHCLYVYVQNAVALAA